MRRTAILVAAAVLVALIGPARAEAAGTDALAWTESGPVRGSVAQGYWKFQGIPYAAPPVGELRWRSPQPPERWSQPRDATAPGGVCAQTAGGGAPGANEDCLYLNVITPAPSGRLKPVMVWVHGGGNSYGAGSDYDPHRLAVGADVVVVTANFRLGLFGFLAHPGLPGSGDFGVEDQQAALRWVRRNAMAFGGDPRTVTLFGESGGANDVCAHLTAPASRGLFDRAIMQSGACSMTWPANGIVYGRPASTPFVSRAKAEADGVAVAAEYGCTDPATAAACLRRVPAADLIAVDRGPTAMVYGNQVLPLHPSEALAQGRFHRVPMISGTTRDEGRLAVAFTPQPVDYAGALTRSFGDAARRVENRYPVAAYGSTGLAWAEVLTDHVWTCPQLVDDRLLARRTAVFTYQFADRQAPTGFFPFPAEVPGGAFHASELSYLFEWAGFIVTRTPAQQRLADQLIAYWGRFAATGNPNGPGLPAWSRFHGSNAQSLAPDDAHPVNLHTQHNCGFWSSVR